MALWLLLRCLWALLPKLHLCAAQDTTDAMTREIELEKKKSEEIDMRTMALKSDILQEPLLVYSCA